jgi:hypothetical protein
MIHTPVRENAKTDLSSPAGQRGFIRDLLGELEREPDFRQRLANVLADEMAGGQPRPRMTYDEFLEWADEDTLAEWVDGEVIMSSPASLLHQELVKFLTRVLNNSPG